MWWNELVNAAIITVDIPWQWFVELLPSVIVQAVLFMGNGDLWDTNYDNSEIFDFLYRARRVVQAFKD